MKIIKRIKETSADGPGIRYAIYVAGCTHQCPGCHNPETWDFNQGQKLDNDLIVEMMKEIQSNPLITGITISGGDPMHPKNAIDLLNLLDRLKDLNKDIWVYTGYTIEEIFESASFQTSALRNIDILVDGKFDKNLREYSSFRGSSNQKFVDVKQTMNHAFDNFEFKIFEKTF